MISSPASSARRSSRCSAASRCSGLFTDGSRPVVPLIKAYEGADVAVGQSRGDSALHAGRLPARRGQVVGAAAARVARAVRLGAGRHRGGGGDALRVLHAVHRRLRRHDPRARRAAAAGAAHGEGYRERFSIGLLTASGSLGLLFPLSLPLILYGIVAQNVAIEDLFIGGLIPGVLMLACWPRSACAKASAAACARRSSAARSLAGLWEAKWELLLPVVVLWALLGGFARRSRVGGDRGALRAHRAALHPPRSAVVQGRRPRRRRLRRAGRRRADDPGGGRRADELPGQRADADAADRVDAGAHRVEGWCSCSR